MEPHKLYIIKNFFTHGAFIRLASLHPFNYADCIIKVSDYKLMSPKIKAGDHIVGDGKGKIYMANDIRYKMPEPVLPHKVHSATEVSILDEAKQIIYGEREKTYGHPAKNLETIAGFWTQYIRSKFNTVILFTPQDICAMMRFVKESRLINTPNHRDSLVDIAGYTALQDRVDENPAIQSHHNETKL